MKKTLYALIFCFILVLVVQVLKRNIEKPQYYAAGYVSVPVGLAQRASSFSHLFIAIYAHEKDKMPFGASRQGVNHDFTRGNLHFVLNEQNFFVMQKGRKFPDSFKIKVTLSHSDKVTPGSSENLSAIKNGVVLGETQANFILHPET